MSLTSYRAAPPRGEVGSLVIVGRVWTLKYDLKRSILLADLAATYSPAP